MQSGQCFNVGFNFLLFILALQHKTKVVLPLDFRRKVCILIQTKFVPLLQHSKSGLVEVRGTGGKSAVTSTELDGSLLEFLRLLARLAVYKQIDTVDVLFHHQYPSNYSNIPSKHSSHSHLEHQSNHPKAILLYVSPFLSHTGF